jgi:hypothetical protein
VESGLTDAICLAQRRPQIHATMHGSSYSGDFEMIMHGLTVTRKDRFNAA